MTFVRAVFHQVRATAIVALHHHIGMMKAAITSKLLGGMLSFSPCSFGFYSQLLGCKLSLLSFFDLVIIFHHIEIGIRWIRLWPFLIPLIPRLPFALVIVLRTRGDAASFRNKTRVPLTESNSWRFQDMEKRRAGPESLLISFAATYLRFCTEVEETYHATSLVYLLQPLA